MAGEEKTGPPSKMKLPFRSGRDEQIGTNVNYISATSGKANEF
jgi:hypothetical protein